MAVHVSAPLSCVTAFFPHVYFIICTSHFVDNLLVLQFVSSTEGVIALDAIFKSENVPSVACLMKLVQHTQTIVLDSNLTFAILD